MEWWKYLIIIGVVVVFMVLSYIKGYNKSTDDNVEVIKELVNELNKIVKGDKDNGNS